jgi:hypothetical protein
LTRSSLKYLLLLVLAPVCHAYGAAGDTIKPVKEKPLNPQSVRHTIKTNPFALVWGPIPFTSEIRYLQEVPVARFQSTQIGFSILSKSFILSLMENGYYQNPHQPRITVRGYRMQFSHRIFFKMEDYAPNGSYISPHISYSSAKFSTRYASMFDSYVRATHFNVTLLGGYQTIMDNYVADIFAGLGYKRNKVELHHYNQSIPIDLDEFPLYESPIKFIIGFNIGWAF